MHNTEYHTCRRNQSKFDQHGKYNYYQEWGVIATEQMQKLHCKCGIHLSINATQKFHPLHDCTRNLKNLIGHGPRPINS